MVANAPMMPSEASRSAGGSQPQLATPPKDSREKALLCARAAIDKKAENLKVLELTHLSSFTDFFVICSGTSDRQVQSIADSVKHQLQAVGCDLLSTEGYSDGRWVLMDFGDVVVHIFLDALRDYYDIEKLWAEAPRVQVPSEYYGQAASRLN